METSIAAPLANKAEPPGKSVCKGGSEDRLPDGQTGAVRAQDLLLRVARRRDHRAFVELFEYFGPRLRSHLLKTGLSPDAADEIAQEALLDVWRSAGSYDPAQSAASTWIFSIARNRRIDYLRRFSGPGANDADTLMIEDGAELPPESVERHEETAMLREALSHLPEDQADMLYKAYFEDESQSEIASERHIPLGTVKSRIRLALDKLRREESLRSLRV